MERFTNQYINLTRKYRDDMGDAEVEKRLRTRSPGSNRGACGVLLYRERAKY